MQEARQHGDKFLTVRLLAMEIRKGEMACEVGLVTPCADDYY